MRTSSKTPTTSRARGAHVRQGEPVPSARERFGGLDLPAAFAGALATLGCLALLGALAASWLNATNQPDLSESLTTTGVIVGLAVIALSALFGGWVAGRCARYDGLGNGLLAGMLLILIASGLGFLANDQLDTNTSFSLPGWVTDGTDMSQSLIVGLVAVAVTLIAAGIGGSLGGHWHRRVDNVLVRDTEESAVTPYPEEHEVERTETHEDMIDEPVDEPVAVSSRRGRARSADDDQTTTE